MTCEEMRSRMTASVVDGTSLQPEARRHVDECASCREELVALTRIWSALADVETPEPSLESVVRFETWLAGQRAVPRPPRRAWWEHRWVWQVAAAMGCLAAGFAMGEFRARSQRTEQELARVKSEMESMKQLLAVSMLGQASASERLRGASLAGNLTSADEQVLAALARTLEEDENINVRLAAVDSLAASSSSRLVRSKLVQALEKQDSPTVQLALIGLLGDLRESTAAPVALRLAQDTSVNPVVRQQAAQLAQRVTRQ